MTETHGPGEDPFEDAYLAEGKVKLDGDERKEEVDGIGKPVIDEMKGAIRKKSSGPPALFTGAQIGFLVS